ncbi:MAG: nickel-dependent lactate racemase [Desulfosarcina sp.]|nr:nickel-dependent lactate racemase [Desulfosarcina sp.]MBC2742391.1 nickel-dependent lactate racemase [Desulfosarcina sp.]MBC2765301.1 nickel-dependent lactate racemase [Desulfosarcina sp.]
MGKSIELKTGSTQVRLSLPDGTDVLKIREPEKTVTEAGFAADLDGALPSQPLGGCRVAVVVADKTRLCGYGRYLPILIDALEERGASTETITLYIAYGTHPAQRDRESRAVYGDVFSRYRFVHHDCTDDAVFADLGQTQRGTPIRIRKDLLDAGLVITFGAISHHYFAGYGGGRKLIFPGLGQRAAIYGNHSLFLDPERRTLSAGCLPGNLDGNPLAEDLAEIESHRPADLAIHGILDSHGTVCRLRVGSGVAHFRQACEFHGKHCEIAADDGYDMVVASCGGYPKDINFIQAHKAVHHAAAFVKDGGSLIVFAQCRDGIGSKTFLPWFDMGGWDAAFDYLSEKYQGNGGTALAVMEKTRRINIFLVTDLLPDVCRTIGVTRLDEKAAVHMAKQHSGSLAVIPNASLLVKRWT